MSKRLRTQAGFTLLEVVLAVAILVVVMTLTYSTMTQMIGVKKVLDDNRDISFIANSILQRMTRELQLAYKNQSGLIQPEDNRDPEITKDSILKGEKGDAPSGAAGDQITFLALEGGQYMPDGGTHSGVVQISYRLAEDPDAPRGGDTFYLVREEIPDIRPREKAFENKMVFPVTKNLVALRFRYYDKNEQQWVDDWGKPPRVNLPAIVEFSVSLKSPTGTIQTFTTAVPLPDVG